MGSTPTALSMRTRKWNGQTRQERKAELTLKKDMTETGPDNEQLAELNKEFGCDPHKFVGYMCGTEFFDEEGQPYPNGNQIFATADAVKREFPCSRGVKEGSCGIVKVEVKFKEWIVPPNMAFQKYGSKSFNNLLKIFKLYWATGDSNPDLTV